MEPKSCPNLVSAVHVPATDMTSVRDSILIAPVDWMGTAGELRSWRADGARSWPGVDGLRGTAILAVLACHYSALFPATPQFLSVLVNGWAGVDLFFVISGFLITGILLDAKSGARGAGCAGEYFRNFYARRILRIFPLYYGFLAAFLLVLVIVGGTSPAWAAQPWLWTYSANYWISCQKAWSVWTETLVPLWSLSVEEQFYVLWPVVVWWCSRRVLVWVCVSIVIGALGLRLLLTAVGVDWLAIYMMTPTRADALAAGALVAALLRGPEGARRVKKLCAFAGATSLALPLVVAGFDPIKHPWLRVLLYTELAVFFAALLWWSIDPSSLYGIPKRFYEWRVLRTIGGYSYGIYIFHLPIMFLTRAGAVRWGLFDVEHPSWPGALGLIGANAALVGASALVSFHFYEKPFLKLKRYFPRNTA
jgi:peptidoglycan/LPS O-acetylase OafA/YrhL